MSRAACASVAGVALLGLALGACATLWPARPRPNVPAGSGSNVPAGSGSNVPAGPGSNVQTVLATHQQKAATLEWHGHLRGALDHLEVALTVDPDHPVVRPARQRLQARIERELAERLRQGRDALDRGVHLEARRHFLAALALDPANQIAVEALRSEVKDVRTVLHTVRHGETLGAIAERYYGDRSRAEVIGEVNRLPPNRQLMAGATLRVPEIPGSPFLTPEPRPRPREEPREAHPRPREQPREAHPRPREEPREPHPLLVEARGAFERGEYAQAGASVDRLLASQPQNPEGLELKKAVLYSLGRLQFEQQRYAESYQTLSRLTKLGPKYEDVPSLLRQARDRLIQQHYSQGLRFFREEKLEEAIAEWRLVMELDPQHAHARRNLEQAERLRKGLEERRKKQ